MTHGSYRFWFCLDIICNGIVLVLDEWTASTLVLAVCVLEFECVIVRCSRCLMWYPIQLRTTMAMTHHGSALILILGGWIHGMVSCWHWTNRAYVGRWYCCLVLCVRIWTCYCLPWCSMHLLWDCSWCAVQIHYDGEKHTNPDWFWFWLNIWNGTVRCWLWTNRAYVGIGACFNLKQGCVVAWCSIHWLQSHNHVMYNSTSMAMIHGSALILILDEYVDTVLALDEQYVR